MAAGDLNMIKNIAESFIVSSNTAVELKLVRQADDIGDENCAFKPDMSHQIFGERENIFGYRDLKIKLYYIAGKLTTYFGIEYSEKVDPDRFEGCQPDNIYEKITKYLPPEFLTNLNDFCNELEKDANFVPYGELKRSFSTEDGERSWEIYVSEVTTPGFLKYHERLQTFLLWYIDAASYIDTDDDHWKFFVVYEKYTMDGSTRYGIAGYATVYEYYAYPVNIRPRISQVLILPPFQRLGLGAQLLDSIYNYYIAHPKVVDITVEDPSEEFQRLRDFVDVKNCRTLPSFQPHQLEQGFTEQMVTEAREKFRLNKKQARRVYEILRLQTTDIHNCEQYRRYRLYVKNRLNVPYQKEQQDLKRLSSRVKDQDVQAALTFANTRERLESLDLEYRELEDQYQRVLQRLALL